MKSYHKYLKEKIDKIDKEESVEESISKNLKTDVLNKPLKYRYQMLGRFQMDADYYFKNPHPKHLWSLDPIKHADNMIALYNTFSKEEQPDWLTDQQLKDYVKKLKSMKENINENSNIKVGTWLKQKTGSDMITYNG